MIIYSGVCFPVDEYNYTSANGMKRTRKTSKLGKKLERETSERMMEKVCVWGVGGGGVDTFKCVFCVRISMELNQLYVRSMFIAMTVS